MISFDFTFRSDLLHWLVIGLLTAYPILCGFLLGRNKSLSRGRKWVRAGLNLLLWLWLVAFWVQPVWIKAADTSPVLLVGQEVPAALARRVQDSLGLSERYGAKEFLKKKLIAQVDCVVVLGQEVPDDLLAQLSSVAAQWIPYTAPDRLQQLNWQGIVRQGEEQRITGRVQSSAKQWVKVIYAGKTLDSVLVSAGSAAFSLHFPAFAEGRTSAELWLGQQLLDSLRFFTRSLPQFSYQFLLGSPDFESRTLAGWLGQQGNPVEITTTVSKDIQRSTTLNGGLSKNALPDLLITDPEHASHTTVKKALNAGKSVLLINLTQPESELVAINRALGTRFAARRYGTEAVPLAPHLTALPYSWVAALPQQLTPGFPVAIWHRGGKAGVSLLNETFPLKLSGDSTTYARLWYTVLSRLQPPLSATLTAEAPLFRGLSGKLQLNTTTQLPSQLSVGADTVALLPQPLNGQTAQVDYLFGASGWLPLNDSLEIYVADSSSALYARRRMADYMRALRTARSGATLQQNRPGRMLKLPDWAWLGLFCLICAALWIEPKR